MRRVLIDSLKIDTEKVEEDDAPSFEPTSRHKRRMRALLANPTSWLHRQERPLWRQTVRRIAVILLICILAFSGTLAFSPTARAAVVRWVIERYGNHITYLYTGEQNAEAVPQYEITELPDGYVETARDTSPGLVAVTYENQKGDIIYFDYSFMHQGTQTDFILNDDDVFDVMVNQMNGQFIESHIPGSLNSLTWIDPDLNIHFTVDGSFGLEELLHIAESVSLYNMMKQ